MYAVMLTFFWLKSGATLPVKLVEAIPLTFGFLAPALFLVRGLAAYKSRFVLVAMVVLGTLLVYDLLLSLVVAKHAPFHLWVAFYPVGSMLLLSLLYTHAVLSTPMTPPAPCNGGSPRPG